MVDRAGVEDMVMVIPEISDDEKTLKKGRKKLLLTGGLATVATIHAAHSVYQSMEKREARRHALKEGEISGAQAKQLKNKNRFQDAAALGIAALGMKGAYSEWHETQETRKEHKEEREKRDRHRAKREARRKKMSALATQNYAGSGYTGSMPNLTAYAPQPHSAFPPPPGAAYGPPPAVGYGPNSAVHYADDNPYAGFAPAPPPSAPHMGFPRAETH